MFSQGRHICQSLSIGLFNSFGPDLSHLWQNKRIVAFQFKHSHQSDLLVCDEKAALSLHALKKVVECSLNCHVCAPAIVHDMQN